MTLQDFKDQVAREWHKESGHYLNPKTNPWKSLKSASSKESLEIHADRAATLFAEHERKEGYKEGWSKGYDIDKTDI